MTLLSFLARPPVNDAQKLSWLRLARTESVGPITFFRLLERFGSPQAALDALPGLSRRGGRAKPVSPFAAADAEKEIAQVHKAGGHFLFAGDDEYPLLLAAIDDAPPVITCLGNPAFLNKPCIGVVGSRNASLAGRTMAQRLSRDLGPLGYTIVSGLARGIDTAAHEAALTAGTAAVVAGGVDVIYPRENEKLYAGIRERGVIVSEQPWGMQPIARHFPRRNRIISGLSQGVVVVEANIKSGSLITARLAAEQGRDVFAVPGSPLDARATGPNSLLRDGAILTENGADIARHLSGFTSALRDSAVPAYTPEPVSAPVTEDDIDRAHGAIAPLLSHVPCAVDDLARQTGLPIPVLQNALLEWELAGKINRLPGNRVILTAAPDADEEPASLFL